MKWSLKEREKYRNLYLHASNREILEGMYVGIFGEESRHTSPEEKRREIRKLIKSYPSGIRELKRIEQSFIPLRGMAATLREMEETLLMLNRRFI